MNIAVVGSGYVGLVAGACFAESGHDVICVDIDERKINALKRGEIPIYEPGLADLVTRNSEQGRLTFTTSLEDGVKNSSVIFIAVGTPPDEDGSADLTHVLAVARGIGKFMNGYKIVVNKSTVPVGTAEAVRKAVAENTKQSFDVVSNPEFLKEGAALDDFLRPDRVVIGTSNEKAAAIMKDLYAPFVRTNNPIIIMDNVSAEMTKYAANTMLAARISLMNEIAVLCEKVGANIESVREGIGTDARIGMSFLFPGLGYGGSCFPKDVRALARVGEGKGIKMEISNAIESVNDRQKLLMFDKMVAAYAGENNLKGKSFAIWGLAFKPQTDDVREAPAITICENLIRCGATLKAFDPEAVNTFQERFGKNPAISYVKTNYDALDGVDALVICTEWNEFRRPNFDKMKQKMKKAVIFDGRNIFSTSNMASIGFVYHSIGRPTVGV